MTYIIGDGPLSEGKRLSVEVSGGSDHSYLDLIVANAKGTVATVSLKLDRQDNLVLHANDCTTPHAPGTLDPSTPVDDVIVARAFEAVPLDAEPVRVAAPFAVEPDPRDITGEAAQHCVAAAAAELAGAPKVGQGTRPKFCPHCGARDIDSVGGAHIERGEWDGREYETDGQAGAYQCHGCGAEFYVWDDGVAPDEPPPLVHKSGSDYEMREPGSFWVTVENLSIYAIRSETGVSVSICPRFPNGAEAEPGADLASCAADFKDAPDEE